MYGYCMNNVFNRLMYCGKYVRAHITLFSIWHFLQSAEPEARAATLFKTPLKPNCMKDVSNMINKLKDS